MSATLILSVHIFMTIDFRTMFLGPFLLELNPKAPP